MSLTQVGKALWARKLSQETCLLQSREPTGDGLALACIKINMVIRLCFISRSLPQGRELFYYEEASEIF